MKISLVLKNTNESFAVKKLEIGHDEHSFAGIIGIEKKIDLYENSHDEANKFYIEIIGDIKEIYCLDFICDRDEQNCIYYFEGKNWTREFKF